MKFDLEHITTKLPATPTLEPWGDLMVYAVRFCDFCRDELFTRKEEIEHDLRGVVFPYYTALGFRRYGIDALKTAEAWFEDEAVLHASKHYDRFVVLEYKDEERINLYDATDFPLRWKEERV